MLSELLGTGASLGTSIKHGHIYAAHRIHLRLKSRSRFFVSPAADLVKIYLPHWYDAAHTVRYHRPLADLHLPRTRPRSAKFCGYVESSDTITPGRGISELLFRMLTAGSRTIACPPDHKAPLTRMGGVSHASSRTSYGLHRNCVRSSVPRPSREGAVRKHRLCACVSNSGGPTAEKEVIYAQIHNGSVTSSRGCDPWPPPIVPTSTPCP